MVTQFTDAYHMHHIANVQLIQLMCLYGMYNH